MRRWGGVCRAMAAHQGLGSSAGCFQPPGALEGHLVPFVTQCVPTASQVASVTAERDDKEAQLRQAAGRVAELEAALAAAGSGAAQAAAQLASAQQEAASKAAELADVRAALETARSEASIAAAARQELSAALEAAKAEAAALQEQYQAAEQQLAATIQEHKAALEVLQKEVRARRGFAWTCPAVSLACMVLWSQTPPITPPCCDCRWPL